MSYLHPNSSENLATRLTNKGRKRIAEGNFNISYFQIGDSEFDYNLTLPYSGSTVLMPFDYDSQIKYPYLSSDSSYTGATFGSVINLPITTSVFNYTGGTETWDYVKVISGDTSNLYLGSKQYFGYGDTGYTSDDIVIIHYSQMGTTGNTFLYEDYISHDQDDVDTYFKITGVTTGDTYTMDTGVTYVYDSGITDTYPNHMAYVDLLSGTTKIGKIFINSKIITIHNQTIVSGFNTGGTINVDLRTLIDIETMNMYVNLPVGYYKKTQNPTWTTGTLMITEIGLFNENRELLVITKLGTPIKRTGNQVINITLDI